jgi:DNA replication and repair protein RecF
MYIKRLELKNFRNYDAQKFVFTPGINVFFGENGTGKTNILESIYWTAMAKSFRTSEDAILVKQGRENAFISIDAVDNDIEKTFLMDYDSINRKKIIKVNGTKLARVSMIVGQVPVVLFSPENIMIVKGEPSTRRRFLDDLLSQIDNEYFMTLVKYNKEVSHRNYLLKGIREGRVKRENLDIWNNQIMENGIKLLLSRHAAVEELNRILKKELTEGKFEVNLGYISKNYPSYSPADLKNSYMEFFKAKVEDEIARSITLIGPHRDDLEISYNASSAKNFASEGQQRITTILMKLSEGLLIKRKRGSYPVVLLDDFSSELDEPNRGFIGKTFSLFKQILITTTYKENLRGFEAAKEFRIQNGRVV